MAGNIRVSTEKVFDIAIASFNDSADTLKIITHRGHIFLVTNTGMLSITFLTIHRLPIGNLEMFLLMCYLLLASGSFILSFISLRLNKNYECMYNSKVFFAKIASADFELRGHFAAETLKDITNATNRNQEVNDERAAFVLFAQHLLFGSIYFLILFFASIIFVKTPF